MEVYLVGGAVRDGLLGREAAERDWLVVGASYQDCLEQGWRPVAEGLPVFRHPESGQEYAMARKERKSGVGYRGFEFEFGPEVTLAEDLLRRDLTINALAQDSDGNLVDPHGFADDIKRRLLRHISSRFTEDPLRVLRLASLYARLRNLGFSIAPATMGLMQDMTQAPEAKEEFASLSPPQLWSQLSKALSSDSPESFLETLGNSGAAPLALPEGLTGQQAVNRLKRAGAAHTSEAARLAVWVAPATNEQRTQFFSRYEAPKGHKRFCERVAELYPFYVVAGEKPIPQILELFKRMDAFSDEEEFSELIHCCRTIHQCTTEGSRSPQVQANFLTTLLHCALRIDRSRILRRNIEGTPKMAEEIDKHRCAEMARVRRYYPWSDLSVGKNRPG